LKRADINSNYSYCKRNLKILVAFLFLFFSFQLYAQISREYNIKAVFLYNFTKFVEWPSNAFSNAEAPFVIGILGDDPFGPSLNEAVAGEKVKGHPIIVQQYQNVNDIKNCHVLFISNNEDGKLGEILSTLPNKNILTVSDIPGFTTTGGIISFMTKENKIKLQINLSVAKATDLNISSKLLQVADIIR
jgi:hypothetical protein